MKPSEIAKLLGGVNFKDINQIFNYLDIEILNKNKAILKNDKNNNELSLILKLNEKKNICLILNKEKIKNEEIFKIVFDLISKNNSHIKELTIKNNNYELCNYKLNEENNKFKELLNGLFVENIDNKKILNKSIDDLVKLKAFKLKENQVKMDDLIEKNKKELNNLINQNKKNIEIYKKDLNNLIIISNKKIIEKNKNLIDANKEKINKNKKDLNNLIDSNNKILKNSINNLNEKCKQISIEIEINKNYFNNIINRNQQLIENNKNNLINLINENKKIIENNQIISESNKNILNQNINEINILYDSKISNINNSIERLESWKNSFSDNYQNFTEKITQFYEGNKQSCELNNKNIDLLFQSQNNITNCINGDIINSINELKKRVNLCQIDPIKVLFNKIFK